MKKFEKLDMIACKIGKILSYISAAALVFMALLTFVDVGYRYVFSTALRGSQEVVEMVMPIVVYGAMVLAVRQKKMISVEFIMERIPKKIHDIIDICLAFVCSATMFVVCWKLFERIGYYMGGTYTTAVVQIPFAPFYAFVAICSFLMGVEFLLNSVKEFLGLRMHIQSDKDKKNGGAAP